MNNEQLRKTALHSWHVQAGAKMVPFAGFDMPVRYSSDLDEHHCVRNKAGIFDVSHMGEFIVQGPGAFALLQYVTSNDVAKLSPGKVQYSCLPNHEGGIVDDLLVYQLDEEKYLLVVNAANIEKDWVWINKHNTFDATLSNVSDEWSLFAVQGPLATSILQTLTDTDLSSIPYYHFAIGTLVGVQDVLLSNTGYTGAGGFEVYVKNADAETVWTAILKAGSNAGIQPIGLGARDTLRLEMGFCLYGNDINDYTSPISAGLGWITKFNKEFINAAALKAEKEKGSSSKLVGFILNDKGIARSGYQIVDAQNNVIGNVTSGTMSPTLGKAIGMGYVQSAYSTPGSQIYIQVRNTPLKATVTKLPFVAKSA
jgi:aminomethyltransferase